MLFFVLFSLLAVLCGALLLGNAGGGWVALAVIVSVIGFIGYRRIRKEPVAALGPAPFAVPDGHPKLETREPVMADEALDEKYRREEKFFRNLDGIFVIGAFSLTVVCFILLFMVNPGKVCLWGGVLGLFWCLAARVIRRYVAASDGRDLEEARDAFLAAHPRPPLVLGDSQACDHYLRHFGSEAEMSVAGRVLSAIDPGFMIYPEDSFYLVCGKRYPEVRRRLARVFHCPLLLTTVGGLVDEVVEQRRIRLDRDIPAELFQDRGDALPPPPLPEFLKAKKWREAPILEEIAKRPEFSLRLFCSYWATREEALIALTLRDLAVDHMSRPESMMCYPNDPVPVLLLLDDDSMESVEFVLAMEEAFGVDIPDAELEKAFQWTLADFVENIQRKQREQIKTLGPTSPMLFT